MPFAPVIEIVEANLAVACKIACFVSGEACRGKGRNPLVVQVGKVILVRRTLVADLPHRCIGINFQRIHRQVSKRQRRNGCKGARKVGVRLGQTYYHVGVNVGYACGGRVVHCTQKVGISMLAPDFCQSAVVYRLQTERYAVYAQLGKQT